MIVAGVVILGLATVALLSLVGWPLATYRDGDFFAFWAGSRSIIEGQDPYDLAWWTVIHAREGSSELSFLWPPSGARWPSVYPLWTDLVLAPFAAVPIAVGAAAWLVTQTLAVLAVVIVLWRRIPGRAKGSLPLVLAILVGSYPFTLLIVGGNMTGLLFAIYWSAVALALAGRQSRAGALLGLLLLKPQAFLVAGPVALATIWKARPRAALASLGVAAVLFVSALVVRPTWIPEWLSAVAIARTVPLSNATLWTLDRAIGGAPFTGPLAVVALLVGSAWWSATRRPSWLWLICASTAVSIAVAPYGWSYDELLLIPLALPIIATASGWRPGHDWRCCLRPRRSSMSSRGSSTRSRSSGVGKS